MSGKLSTNVSNEDNNKLLEQLMRATGSNVTFLDKMLLFWMKCYFFG